MSRFATTNPIVVLDNTKANVPEKPPRFRECDVAGTRPRFIVRVTAESANFTQRGTTVYKPKIDSPLGANRNQNNFSFSRQALRPFDHAAAYKCSRDSEHIAECVLSGVVTKLKARNHQVQPKVSSPHARCELSC